MNSLKHYWDRLMYFILCVAIATIIVLLGARLYFGPGKIIEEKAEPVNQSQELPPIPGVNGGM